MLKDITIGQYYPSDSLVHRLDPRTKIILTFMYMLSVFMLTNLQTYVFVAISLMIFIKLSNIPYKFIIKGIKPVIMLLVFSVVVNLFFTQGRTIVQIGFLKITYEGLYFALLMLSRLILLIMGSSLMTFTTTPIRLTDGIEKLFSPFKKIGFPAHEIAMMMSIAIRSIPILIEEADKIMKAQMARGADFETGSILRRAKALVPILIPLFISSFRRADELAMAMESRCYRGAEGRTKLNPLQYKTLDYKAYAVFSVYIIFLLLIDRLVF